jgi:predicted phage-related endonuclease
LTIEVITPKDEAEWLALRVGLLTTTKVPALFGCGYTTEFAEWHAAHDGIEIPFTETERTKWGRRFEASIAAGVAEDEGWDIRPMKEFYRDPDRRLGASFDFAIGDDGVLEGFSPVEEF